MSTELQDNFKKKKKVDSRTHKIVGSRALTISCRLQIRPSFTFSGETTRGRFKRDQVRREKWPALPIEPAGDEIRRLSRETVRNSTGKRPDLHGPEKFGNYSAAAIEFKADFLRGKERGALRWRERKEKRRRDGGVFIKRVRINYVRK